LTKEPKNNARTVNFLAVGLTGYGWLEVPAGDVQSSPVISMDAPAYSWQILESLKPGQALSRTSAYEKDIRGLVF
jgi:hypothetical protein